MIRGPSGSGKSSLIFGLLEAAEQNENAAAYLVSDDQVCLMNDGGVLIASAPPTIAGKIELRGFGIIEKDYLASTRIRLICDLVEDEKLERLPEPKNVTLEGVTLPLVELPRRHEQRAVRITMANINQYVS